MAIVVHGVVKSNNGNGFTTPAFDSTGGGGLGIAALSTYTETTSTLTDNKGNTWTRFAGHTGSQVGAQLFYCEAPVVGTGHTFTVPGPTQYPCFEYAFLSDVLVHDGTNARGAAAGAGVPTIKPGSTTPSAANAWLFTAATGSGTSATAFSIDSGFTIIDQSGFVASQAFGGALAYKTLTTPSAQDPTWTNTDSSWPPSAAIGSFIPVTERRIGAIGVTADLLFIPVVSERRVGALGVMADLLILPTTPKDLSGTAVGVATTPTATIASPICTTKNYTLPASDIEIGASACGTNSRYWIAYNDPFNTFPSGQHRYRVKINTVAPVNVCISRWTNVTGEATFNWLAGTTLSVALEAPATATYWYFAFRDAATGTSLPWLQGKAVTADYSNLSTEAPCTPISYRNLTGSAAGVAAASGTISKGSAVSYRNLTGSAAGSAAASATISKGASGALTGASAGVASTVGTLRRTRALTGLSAGSATVSGSVTRQPALRNLTGLSAGRATVTGQASTRGRLTGLSAGVATTNRASFARRMSLYYYGGGKATTTGALSVTRGSSTGSGGGDIITPPPPDTVPEPDIPPGGVTSPPSGTLLELSQATVHAPRAMLTIGGEILTMLAGDDDPEFLQATATYGRTLGSAVMTVTLPGDPPGAPASYVGQPIMLEAGWAGAVPGTMIIFSGSVTQDQVSNYFPYRRQLRCHGPSHRLSRRLQKALSFNSDGANPWTDISIIRRIAQAQAVSEANIGTLQGLGDEHPLFKYHELRLTAGSNPQGVWTTLDQIGGFWSHDIPSNPPQFIRTRWNPTPSATPVLTISEGSSNVRDIRLNRDPDSRVAALTVTGFQIGGWRPYASRVDHTAPPDERFGDTFNTDYIETEALADLAVDVGMRERNSEHAIVSIDVPGNPYLLPGVTFAVHSQHAGIPTPTNFLCSEVTHNLTARSWRTTASGLMNGAAGATGDNMHRPAIAIVDTFIARQTIIRDGEPVMVYAINADGRNSRDVRGYLEEGELSLSFAWSNNKHGTEGNPSVVEQIYHEEFSVEEYGSLDTDEIVPRNRPRVYLTLTDRDGNVAEAEQTVDGLTTIRGVQERELYAVNGGDGWCTPNGGGVQRTMNFGAGISALCVPPITGPEWGWFGLDNGMLAFTQDYLLTWQNRGPEGSSGIFLDALGLPDPVLSLWVHERDPYRITVGTQSGRIWTSPDAGRTWALAYQAEEPTPITMVTESYTNMGQVFFAEGDVVRYSDNLFRAPYAGVVDYIGYGGVVAGFTLSFIDHYAFGSNGLRRQRDEITISLPGSTSTHVFAFHGLNDGLWVCDRDGHSWMLTEGQDEAEPRVDVAGEGDIRWVMRDGTLPLECYVARASGLYKSWTGMRSWELVASGNFSMVGYGGANEKGDISGSSNVPPEPEQGEGAPGAPTVFVGSSSATLQFRVLEGESFMDGWEGAGFDDGGWNPSVRAEVDEDQVYPYECYPIWTTATPAHDYEEVAFRVHFTLSEIPNAEPIFQVIADDILAEVYINGMPIVPPGEYTFNNDVWTMAFSPDMLVVGDNVLALRAIQVAPTAAMAAFLLTVSYYR